LTRQSIYLRKNFLAKKMDARVKPAHDPVESLPKSAPMGRDPGIPSISQEEIARRPPRSSAVGAARTSVGYRLPGFGALVPVVELSSGTHVIALRSYLNPLAFLSASLLVFITKYHLLLSLV